MVETVEDKLKQAKLEEQLRRNRMAEADEELRARAFARDAALRGYLDRLDEEEAILWTRSTNDAETPSLGAVALSWLMDISRRRMLALRPGVLSPSNSAISAAMMDSSARCPSSSRPTSDSSCTSVSEISSSEAKTTAPANVKEAEFVREFGHRVESVEFVRRLDGAEVRTVYRLHPAEGKANA